MFQIRNWLDSVECLQCDKKPRETFDFKSSNCFLIIYFGKVTWIFAACDSVTQLEWLKFKRNIYKAQTYAHVNWNMAKRSYFLWLFAFFSIFHYQCSVSPSLFEYGNYNGKQQLAYHILYHRIIIICTLYCLCIESIHLNSTKRLWQCSSVARVMSDCIQICIHIKWMKNGKRREKKLQWFLFSFVCFFAQKENIFMKIRRSASFGLGIVILSFKAIFVFQNLKWNTRKPKKERNKPIVVQCTQYSYLKVLTLLLSSINNDNNIDQRLVPHFLWRNHMQTTYFIITFPYEFKNALNNVFIFIKRQQNESNDRKCVFSI